MIEKTSSPWKNRIIGSGIKSAADFLAHELNWKIHPTKQQDGIEASLDQVGWYKSVVESARSGKLLDGHARIMLALRQGEDTPIPYELVDVSEDEEAIILATLDPLASLAMADKKRLDSLLKEMPDAMDSRLQDMLAELANKEGLYADEGIPDPLDRIDLSGDDTETPRVIITFQNNEEKNIFWDLMHETYGTKPNSNQVIYAWSKLSNDNTE